MYQDSWGGSCSSRSKVVITWAAEGSTEVNFCGILNIPGTDFAPESHTSESPWLIMNAKPLFAREIAGSVTAVLHIDKELLSILDRNGLYKYWYNIVSDSMYCLIWLFNI